jgi:hypothetical protein
LNVKSAVEQAAHELLAAVDKAHVVLPISISAAVSKLRSALTSQSVAATTQAEIDRLTGKPS